ncbi:abortive phage infection protein [Streptomyces sp. XD-27]|uniref:abortive phage infection protein n=1 Tax=Streptomyces sp. XD-27 TaxID=3062779 RepID=UPI0026F40CA2|nr:abortive phage infection protein [Streptomyces sp. XD-27]WKX70123.1 abortive phage infection protein [Streptomyces sp. XD-27]
MRTEGISRARFLAGAGAVGAAVSAGSLMAAGRAQAAGAAVGAAAGAGEGPGLAYRGVCYEVGKGETPGTAWNAARVRKDIRVIKEELHAGSVSVFGDGVERLTAASSEAAERGLHVWLQPRLRDRPQREILDHLAETGRHAERLRRQGARVHLSVGCEFVLFVPGIVPGADVMERIENMTKGNFDPVQMKRRLRSFVARSASVGRSVFHGPLTYAAAFDEAGETDWGLFDIVSVNYYAYHPRRSDYVRELTPYLRWGKPVAISEFGSCTFVGAPEQGGMGWNAVDYSKEPPEIVGDLVRSERTQAAYLTDMLDVFESMGLYAALVYNFVSPDSPHRPEPRYDLDMASYSIVKTIKDRPEDPASAWHWEPKQAFHALARHYGRARC